jgi:biopolymer transport protein ExbB
MKKAYAVTGLALAAFLIAGSFMVFGQAAAPSGAGAPAVAAPGAGAPANKSDEAQWNTLWDMWVVGGPCMWPLGATSVLALGLAIYGFIVIRTDKMMRPDLIPQLQEAFNRLNLDEANNICNGAPCTLTNILGSGLKRISDGVLDVESMEKAMEEASVEETNEGLKPLNNLSVCAQVAPMLGLLGTITGMIGAFNKIGMGAMGDPEKLADDIGEAMITTAFGLMIAIPAMFAYFYLKAKYMSLMSKMSRVIGNLMHHLVVSSRRAEGQVVMPSGGAPAPAESTHA